MFITITSIRLKSFWKFFALSLNAMQIMKQMKTQSGLKKFKKRGAGTLHFTMTAWENEADLKRFAGSGAHLKAMQQSAALAKEIRTYTYESTELPNWKTAKQLLNDRGRLLSFDKKPAPVA